MNSELLIIASAFVGGLMPLFACGSKSRAIWPLAATLGLASLLLGLSVSWRGGPRDAKATAVDRPIEAPGTGYGFTSSRTCQACHPQQYATWHQSYHRRMTQVATPETVIGDFDEVHVVAYGREFLLTRRGEEYWVNMDDPDSLEIGRSPRIDRRVVLTTGSHHMQVYWYATGQGRRLGQLPVTWLCETNRWVPRSAVFIAPPPQPLKSEEGRWNDTCIKCHTTHGRPRIDESRPARVDSHVAEFGISCEACHGPAEAHVAANRNPRRRYAQHLGDAVDQTILHPQRLSHRRASQMCGQSYGLLKAIRSHQVSSPSVQESVNGVRPNACNLCHIDKTLAWTADHLEARYGIVKPANLTSNQRRYAASVLWCLTGDAGQRALAAWTLGWPPAQQASRTDWVAPILAQLLADPYDAVRHIAHRSLRTVPEFADFKYDYVGTTQHHADSAIRAYRVWLRESAPRLSVGDPAVLISPDGGLLLDDFQQLNQVRDNREVLLLE